MHVIVGTLCIMFTYPECPESSHHPLFGGSGQQLGHLRTPGRLRHGRPTRNLADFEFGGLRGYRVLRSTVLSILGARPV